jgi:hypothetical protein
LFSVQFIAGLAKDAYQNHLGEENPINHKLPGQLQVLSNLLVEFTENTQYSKLHQAWFAQSTSEADQGDINNLFV